MHMFAWSSAGKSGGLSDFKGWNLFGDKRTAQPIHSLQLLSAEEEGKLSVGTTD